MSRTSIASRAAQMFRAGQWLEVVQCKTGLPESVLRQIRAAVMEDMRRENKLDQGPDF